MKLDWRFLSLGNETMISTSLTSTETAKLQKLASNAAVLEIGSAYGYSAIAMALHGAKVTAIDPHIWLNSYQVMQDNMAAYQVSDQISVITDWSINVLPAMTDQFDLIWIDGDHEEGAVSSDVRLALPLLRDNGVLACHDYGEVTCPGVRLALDKILGTPHELIDTLALYYKNKIQ